MRCLKAGFFIILAISLGLAFIVSLRFLFVGEAPTVIHDATHFPHLILTAHPDVPIAPGQNIVWCDTMQLAWNQAIETLGGKLQFDNPPGEVEKLNAQQYTKADLAPSDYAVVSDLASNGAEKQIRDIVAKRFGGNADVLPDLSNLDADSLVFYSAIYTRFIFYPAFDQTPNIKFAGKDVKSFGLIPKNPSGEQNVEVSLSDYKDDSNFIIQIRSKDIETGSKPVCQVILAKIPPEPTLQETMNTVLKAIVNSNYISDRDELRVPKFDFRMSGKFPELEGLKFRPWASTSLGSHPVKLSSVTQNIRFKMDEHGVELTSFGSIESVLSVTLGTPKHLVFDSPFLLMLKRPDSLQPFLAIWIADPSLLVSAD